MNRMRSRFVHAALLVIFVSVAITAQHATWADQPYISPETEASPVVQVRLESQWRSDPPPGLSLTFKGGGLIDRNFPAVSADRSRIALLYMADHPMLQGYPTFEVWSTKNLKRLQRMQLVPGVISASEDHVDVDAPETVAAVERQLVDVNRILADGGFRRMEVLYDAQIAGGALAGFENFGKKIDYPGADASLVIASSATGRIELKLEMPVIPTISGSDDPLNDCEVRGDARQAWYELEKRIVVVRMTFISARDGCDQPERWVLKRL